jgi:hypothetical protein
VPSPIGAVYAMQSWDPDGAGPLPSVLVAGGSFTVGHETSVQVATHDGTVWQRLGGT